MLGRTDSDARHARAPLAVDGSGRRPGPAPSLFESVRVCPGLFESVRVGRGSVISDRADRVGQTRMCGSEAVWQ